MPDDQSLQKNKTQHLPPILEWIESTELSEIVTNLLEATIDIFHEDGLIRDLPIAGTILKTLQLSGRIRDYLFLRKTGYFLYEIQSIPQEKRQRFLARIEASQKAQNRIGENLILLLERQDAMQKASMLGLVYKAFMEEKISKIELEQLSIAIDRLKISDIISLVNFYTNPSQGQTAEETFEKQNQLFPLAVTGLVDQRIGYFDYPYKPNNLGKLFLEIVHPENFVNH